MEGQGERYRLAAETLVTSFPDPTRPKSQVPVPALGVAGCISQLPLALCDLTTWWSNFSRVARFLVRNSLMRSCEAISESCSSMPVPMLWLLVPPNNRHRKFDRQPWYRRYVSWLA